MKNKILPVRKNRAICLLFLALVSCLFFGCLKNDFPYTPPIVSANFIKGADISWVTQMEASNIKFYNSLGLPEDLFVLMGGVGMNTIRLRAWVNPANGWCGTADLVKKAIRAKNAGLKIVIDFHYSDTWADSTIQTPPAAWASLSLPAMETAMYSYTINVLDTLKSVGVTPDYVQIGNEVARGMLWPLGASTNMANFAGFVQTGYNAVKSASPNTKVIVHLAAGVDSTLYRQVFDGLKANGAKWDIIGMSLYPNASNYTIYDKECIANINGMVARYGTPCMLMEVGMPADDPKTCLAFLTDIITKVNAVSNGNGLGVMYWEPESYNNWQNYTKAAFTNSGSPSEAMDAFGY